MKSEDFNKNKRNWAVVLITQISIAALLLLATVLYATDIPVDYNTGDRFPAAELNQILGARTEALRPIDDTTRSYSDNTEDLGSVSFQWRDGYFGRNVDILGDLGVGTATPLNDLHVESVVRLSSNETASTNKTGAVLGSQYDSVGEAEGFSPVYIDSNISDNILFLGGGNSGFNAATNLRFYTAANTVTRTGSERMRVQSDGSVGIGITNPQGKLNVVSIIDTPGTANISDYELVVSGITDTVGYETGIGFRNSLTQPSRKAMAAISLETTGTAVGSLHLKTAAGSNSEALTRMTVESGGDIGIGTSNPTEKLHVNGSVLIEDDITGVDSILADDGTAALPAYSNNGDPNTGMWFPAADTIAFSTGGSERFRIDDDGPKIGDISIEDFTALNNIKSNIQGAYQFQQAFDDQRNYIVATADRGAASGLGQLEEMLQYNGFLYVTNSQQDTVEKFNATSLVRVATINVLARPQCLILDWNDDIWVSCRDDDAVVKIDTDTDTMTVTINVDDGGDADPRGLTTDEEFIYVANSGEDQIVKISVTTNSVVGRTDLVTLGTTKDCEYDGEFIWAIHSDANPSYIYKINPDTMEIVTTLNFAATSFSSLYTYKGYLYVIGVDPNEYKVYDVLNEALLYTDTSLSDFGFWIVTDGEYLYLSRGASIIKAEPLKNGVLTSIPGFSTIRAITIDSNYLYAMDTNTSILYKINI
jgi:hypothetical protein